MSGPIVCDRPIAWVCKTREVGGKTEIELVREGMSRAEIVEAFPPHHNSLRYGMDYNRLELVKAIIYEAYREVVEQGVERPRQNVRGFWYERLMHTLMAVMGEPGGADNIASIDTTINAAWRQLVEEGWVTYRALNIYSEKEDLYHIAVAEDSPYPTAIVLVEKAAYFEPLHDLADTYEIAYCSTGGQNSRAAALAYAEELRRLGVALGQPFTVFSFCDFDPEGWDIPLSFCDHLALKVSGPIRLVRLGVLREQLGESVIQHQATPWPMDARTASARKSKRTKYARFAEETGGLFIPGPGGELIPGRVELNIYDPDQVRERILQGLAHYLDGFSYQVRAVKGWIANEYENGDWEPEDPGDALDEVYDPYYETIDERRHQIDDEAESRAPEARAALRRLNREYWERRKPIDAEIEEETADLEAKKEALSELSRNLETMYRNERDLLLGMPNVGETDFDDPQEAFAHIEDNGGWREWMEQQQIEIVNPHALTEAAQQHGRYVWQPDWEERERIREWMADHLIAELWYDDPDGPGQTPEEMIAEVLGE
jgi:hypothetical protein